VDAQNIEPVGGRAPEFQCDKWSAVKPNRKLYELILTVSVENLGLGIADELSHSAITLNHHPAGFSITFSEDLARGDLLWV
jgi:hypothetical protein